ncbi:MAG: rhodanese-like domain-containing protein [Myxococcota bacterium]
MKKKWWLAVGLFLLGALALAMLSFRPNPVTGPELQQLLADGARLVDVRSPEEFRGGAVPGAVNIPISAVVDGIRSENLPKNAVILLYCASGVRSARAESLLKGAGYKNARNIGGLSSLPEIVGVKTQ